MTRDWYAFSLLQKRQQTPYLLASTAIAQVHGDLSRMSVQSFLTTATFPNLGRTKSFTGVFDYPFRDLA